MATVLLVIHLMVAAALVGVVLLQKSEGGALGMGGGGSGGFLTGRGTANLLTRVTAGLAAAFFTTSILLTILAKQSAPVGSVFDKATTGTPVSGAPAAPGAPATPGTAPGTDPAKPAEGRGGILDKLQPPAAPQVPANQ
jgi:preprotein translocase subunit SecG